MIIAFVAPKQFGKSTACNILKEYWGDDVVQINFKDALIAEIKQNFPDLLDAIYVATGVPPEKLFEVKHPLIRTLMQNYGTEVRRGDNDNYWVDRWMEAVMDSDKKYILVDDVRFMNEALAVWGGRGICIRLNRTDKTSTDTHSSETEQASIKCDYSITVGEGEFTELEYQLKLIVDSL